MSVELRFQGIKDEGGGLKAEFDFANSGAPFRWSQQELEDGSFEQDAREHGFTVPEEEVSMALRELSPARVPGGY